MHMGQRGRMLGTGLMEADAWPMVRRLPVRLTAHWLPIRPPACPLLPLLSTLLVPTHSPACAVPHVLCRFQAEGFKLVGRGKADPQFKIRDHESSTQAAGGPVKAQSAKG